jgi:hypothetical protein
MPYSVYTLYQAERVKTDAERRQADLRLGMQAAAMSEALAALRRPARTRRRHRAERAERAERLARQAAAGCDPRIAC